MSALETPRVLALEAAYNFRDLGGYHTADGRVTKWRTLFRADGLHRLTDADLRVMRDIGLRTVIDLRTENELVERGRFPLDSHPVGYHHVSLMDVIWDPGQAPVEASGAPVADFLLERYVEMIDGAGRRIGDIFAILAEPDALPAVFHCAAGKDRTGILAALLLSSLGVADADVVTDYALTGEAVPRMLAAWKAAEAKQARPDSAAAVAAPPAAFLAAEPDAMARLLALIRAVHGSIRAYLRTLGVSGAVLADLESALLEPRATSQA
jgi:protein-tyrosine phosphatase